MMLIVCVQHLATKKALLPVPDVIQAQELIPNGLHEKTQAGKNAGDASGNSGKQ